MITFFLPGLFAGGAEAILLRLAAEFSRRGIPCQFVVASSGGVWENRVPTDVQLIHLGSSKPIRAIPALVRHLRSHRPHAVISTVFAANLAAIAACRIARVRCVIREAYWTGEELSGRTRLSTLANRLAVKQLYPRADAIISLSRGLASHVRTLAHINPARVAVIPNPITLKTDSYEVVTRDPLALLGCGRLEPQKNFGLMIRALAIVRQRFDAKLTLIGEGSERESLATLAKAEGVEEYVSFAGYQANPGAWMRRCGIFLSSSWLEGFPNVLAEALANGCQVVATSSSDAVNDLLDDGRLGHIVPTGDLAAFAAAISQVLDGESKFPTAASHLVKYDIQSIADAYLDVIDPKGLLHSMGWDKESGPKQGVP